MDSPDEIETNADILAQIMLTDISLDLQIIEHHLNAFLHVVKLRSPVIQTMIEDLHRKSNSMAIVMANIAWTQDAFHHVDLDHIKECYRDVLSKQDIDFDKLRLRPKSHKD